MGEMCTCGHNRSTHQWQRSECYGNRDDGGSCQCGEFRDAEEADELARVTAERDELRRLAGEALTVGDPWKAYGLDEDGGHVYARRDNHRWSIADCDYAPHAEYIAAADPRVVLALIDEVTRLDAELTGVRASLVEQAEDAEDARGVVAMRDGQLREALAERDAALTVVGRVEALAAALVREYDAACPDWWPDAMGPLWDALAGAQATTTGADEAVDPAEPNGVHRGTQGVHVDLAPDPRPQQIIDDPKGWFDAARDKRTAEVLAEAAGRAKEAAERRLGR